MPSAGMARWFCRSTSRPKRKTAARISAGFALVFIAILGFSTGKLIGWQNANNTLNLVLVDEGGDERVERIASALRSRAGVRLTIVDSAQRAYAAVDDGDAQAARGVAVGPPSGTGSISKSSSSPGTGGTPNVFR